MPDSTPRIDKFLVGDNPFAGVDHLSRERARDRSGSLGVSGIVEVIDTALAHGAQGFSFSTQQKMYDVLTEMKKREYPRAFGMYPLLPYAQEYVRLANEKGTIGLAREVFSKLTWKGKAKTLARGGLSLVSFDPFRILETYIDAELNILLKSAPPGAVLKTVLLHEVITDLAVSLEATELIQRYFDYVLDEYNVKPGFETRNFARFVRFAEQCGLSFDRIVILAPFNKIGFQMNPSREECEHALDRAGKDSVVIAMSILASGYLSLTEALEYIHGLRTIGSYVVGVSSTTHASQTFSEMVKWDAARF